MAWEKTKKVKYETITSTYYLLSRNRCITIQNIYKNLFIYSQFLAQLIGRPVVGFFLIL